jgi:hypothetical protein
VLAFSFVVYMLPVTKSRCGVNSLREGDPDVDGRIILKWIFRKWEGVVWTG